MYYTPDMDSISTHKMPDWFPDAKLGIFIHWGMYSVPAYAPPTWELGAAPEGESWILNNPYAEWYMNTLRLKDSPTYKHHEKTYGLDFPYEGFIDMWKAEKWDPANWSALFKKSGAKYVIPVTKHHDGYCLWGSQYTDYNTTRSGPGRDIIKELAAAVRKDDMRLGLYYSGILDWRFAPSPIGGGGEMHRPENRTYAYADYAYNQFMELITLFKPDILWNDIGWPEKGICDLPTLFAYYYNNVPEGLVNDRWSGTWHDYTLREYQTGETDFSKVWENTRGIGLSFGYNAQEEDKHLLSHHKLISLLVNTVAKNGNLLINVGPKADGTIPTEQESRLLALGKWLTTHGEGIYGTRPFTRQHEKAENGTDIYFTQKGDDIYVFFDNMPPGESIVNVKGIAGEVKLLDKGKLTATQNGADLTVSLTNIAVDNYPVGLKIG